MIRSSIRKFFLTALLAALGAVLAAADDQRLEELIRDALLESPAVRSYVLVVAVEDGVAELRGVVGSEDARRAAAEIARGIDGVREVENGLIVRPEVELIDDEIELYVDQALSRDPIVDSNEIVVTVLEGEVDLNGTVDTEAERERATLVASRVLGVREVRNELTLPLAKSPPELSDADLHDAVERALKGAFEGVEVDVERGVVTLRGTVASVPERQRAEQEAFAAGATLVKNELEVREGRERD